METKKYAVVENGVIINTTVATPEYASEQGWIEISTEPGSPGIGYLYQDGNFLPPPRNIEAEWVKVRAQRDQLLLESDVYVLPDRWASMTVEQQTAWSDYRQELRDLPQNFEDPIDVIYPTKPE